MLQPQGALIVRAYADGDALRLAEIFREAVATIGPADYSAAQVNAWLARVPSAERLAARLGDGRKVWVLSDASGDAFGFVDLEADGHIDLLYASPVIAGTGAVERLVAHLETAARDAGLTRLYVEASAAARRFFLKHGFTVLERRTFEIGGVAIFNFAMAKAL